MQKNKESSRAVIYARYSSDKQTEQSIEGQLHDCTEYAKKHNIQIVGQYIDRALTATSDKRPDFQRMIADSSKQAFDTVLVWKLDRFSRDRYDSAMYKKKLKKNGVKVISVMENISDTPEGILMESVLEGFAEYFSRDLAQKVTRGMRETAKKHKITGMLPFGYTRTEDNRYTPDPKTAPAVRKVFEMYLDGESKTNIAEWLNNHGYKTAYGNAFTKNAITPLISKTRYIGKYTYGDMELTDEAQRIIDDETFYKAQRMIHANWRHGSMHKAKERYLLSQKLYCGYCNKILHGESALGRNNKTYIYYSCSGRKKDHICSNKRVKQSDIEDLIINNIQTNLCNNPKIKRIIDRMVEIQREQNTESANITILESQLESVRKKIKNIMNAIEAGIITPTTQARLSELEEQKGQFEYELAVSKSKDIPISREEIVSYFQKITAEQLTEWQNRQRLIDTFVHRVYIWKDKILIIYRIAPRINGNDPDEKTVLKIKNSLSEDVSDSEQLGSSSWARIKNSAFCTLS